MKKRALALILSVATAMAMLTACGGSTGASTSTEPAAASTEAAAVETAEVGEPVESTIYPTPEGVSYTAIAEGKSAPDWTEYEALIK